jgi:hypothetical protein
VRAAALACALALGAAEAAAADRLDWDPAERDRGPWIAFLRGERDAVVGLLDDALDLQLGVFAEAALLVGTAFAGASDVVGLVDDNPVTQHVTKGVASKSLARTAYLFHLAGAESILGSHGLETERWLAASLADLNPLVDPEEAEPVLPLEPLEFVREGLVHPRPWTARVPLAIALASIAADGAIRPLGNLARLLGLRGIGDRVESAGTALVRSAVP